MFPSTQTTLMLPSDPQKTHPLQKTLLLLMCHHRQSRRQGLETPAKILMTNWDIRDVPVT